MTDSDKKTVAPCPTCGAPAIWDQTNPWRPFCSERCKLIDLGEWFEEEKRIPGEPAHLPEDNEH